MVRPLQYSWRYDIDLIEDDGDDVDEIEEYDQRKEQRAISRVAPTRVHDELGLS